MQFLRVTAYML